MYTLFKKNQRGSTYNRGFTLIELVVVLGIIVVISTVMLVSYSKFGGKILLSNLAYDIALTIREAQVYGLSGRNFGGSSSSVGHGIYADLGATNTQFTLYKDTDASNYYTNSSEIADTYNIGSGYTLEQFCFMSGTTESCTSSGKLDILFKRPEPDAIIRGDVGNGSWKTYDSVNIFINSRQKYKLSIFVGNTGQISVKRVAP